MGPCTASWPSGGPSGEEVWSPCLLAISPCIPASSTMLVSLWDSLTLEDWVNQLMPDVASVSYRAAQGMHEFPSTEGSDRRTSIGSS